ncbi:hypothetical protein [Streptomyces sp. NPDC090445]|uniref:hypothetical protein n=1 Tax=Streptomyces sp. NPDC090445 TaxID=3365963 RepID=UPI003828EBD3
MTTPDAVSPAVDPFVVSMAEAAQTTAAAVWLVHRCGRRGTDRPGRRGVGASVRRLTASDARPPAVLGDVRVAERFRPGSGGLRVTLSWPASLRGAAAEGSAAEVRHGVPYARPGEDCVCRRCKAYGFELYHEGRLIYRPRRCRP